MPSALASELGPDGVRVNAIHPGLVETTMATEDVRILGTKAAEESTQTIPSRWAGQPEVVADAALFFATDMAGYVDGESLVVDGGTTSTG